MEVVSAHHTVTGRKTPGVQHLSRFTSGSPRLLKGAPTTSTLGCLPSWPLRLVGNTQGPKETVLPYLQVTPTLKLNMNNENVLGVGEGLLLLPLKCRDRRCVAPYFVTAATKQPFFETWSHLALAGLKLAT